MPEESHLPFLLRAEPVARRLGVSAHALRRMAEQRIVPSYSVGGMVLFNLEEVLQRVAENCRVPALGEDPSAPKLILSRPPDTGMEAGGNIRLQAMCRILARIAGRVENPETQILKFDAETLASEAAQESGSAALIASGTKSPNRSIGKGLARLRGAVLKDTRNRAFEILRESTKAGAIYQIRFQPINQTNIE